MTDNYRMAEYLGWKLSNDPGSSNMFYRTGDKVIMPDSLWTPNTNWNQLMQVIEKIEEHPGVYDVVIAKGRCYIWFFTSEYTDMQEDGKNVEVLEKDGPNKILAAYNTCLTYIKNFEG